LSDYWRLKMETIDKTLWELLNEYKISIPIIQRDYAQGRIEEKEKRSKFIEVLYKHLTYELPLDLDFVYGRVFDNVFFPIDGQQRLTTLFLLHWYISTKENISDSLRQNLVKFVYDTRISSREFCKALIEKQVTIPPEANEDNFIVEIQNNRWFRDAWKKDPTIKAMLIMIQSIHEKFGGIQDLQLWNKLTCDRLITFHVLDLGSKGFELTDELYIKMNARGKQLTPFENFKANFIQFIDKTFKNEFLQHPIKGKISYSSYFSYKIEKEWADLFWTYRDKKINIDDMFMNYFGFISQMCYFRSKKNAKAEDFKNNFEQFESLFKEKENLFFLFDSLDKLFEISLDKKTGLVNNACLQSFFESLFRKEEMDDNYCGQVKLFWNQNSSEKDLNLFERCILDFNYDIRNKIVLFCLLYYILENKSDNGLKDYIRVIRNLLMGIRQRNETKFNTNVRINNFASYWILFKKIASINVYGSLLNPDIDAKGTQITDASLRNEKEKARIICADGQIKDTLFSIEEFTCFEGLIHLLEPAKNVKNLPQYKKVIGEIWGNSISDTLRIKALIACGFCGIHIRDCNMGKTKYFGKMGNWSAILTCEDKDKNVSRSLTLLLDKYENCKNGSVEERLKSIVEGWLKNNKDKRSWEYYFLQYDEFTSKSNYYAWKDEFALQILGSESFNPLLAYHINPYVLTVCKKIDDKNICDERDCYQQYTGNYPLVMKNTMTLKSSKEGWEIDTKTKVLPPSLVDQYNMVPTSNEGSYILKESKAEDRIQAAVKIIEVLKNL